MIEAVKKIIIIGMGKSGLSSAALCLRQGHKVTLYDANEKPEEDAQLTHLIQEGVLCRYGNFLDGWLDGYDLMVLSPGVPTELPFIKQARLKMQVIGEIELAYHYGQGVIVGITGTNGKTTTTTLVGEILSSYDAHTYVVGNIGMPYTDVADRLDQGSKVVIELSSYQLESIVKFRAHVSCILNLTEDHLQRHKTMANYGAAKLRITMNQMDTDFCVLNFDDAFCVDQAQHIKAQVVWISRKTVVQGVYVLEDQIYSNFHGVTEHLMAVDEIRVLGSHNVENVIAAMAISLALNIPKDYIVKAIKAFKGVPHRLEYVDTIKGVKYYNDSKATNPDAAIKGVEAMNRPTVLIAGGMDKESDYSEWIGTFSPVIKHLVLFGETKEAIKQACDKEGYKMVTLVNGLKEAVLVASELADAGDHVLLSPACASWDMFRDFEARGELFKDIVKEISR